MTTDAPHEGRTPREVVRFYLLDHRTPLGKAIDIALLALNLVFVAIFVAETYPVSPGLRDALWTGEVAIALAFLVEYLLRLYGAENRLAEFFDGYTMVDLIAILPTLLVATSPASASFAWSGSSGFSGSTGSPRTPSSSSARFRTTPCGCSNCC